MEGRTYGTLTYRSALAESTSSRRPAGVWRLTVPPHIAMRVKHLFARVSTGRTGTITIAATPEVARDLEWMLLRWPMHVDPVSQAKLTADANHHRGTEDAVTRILAGDRLYTGGRVPARAPRQYQQQAADIVKTRGSLLCTDELGLGKSNTGLLVLAADDALPAVVVTLTHLTYQWLDELALTWPDMLGHVVTSGKPYDPTRKRGVTREPDVLILNYAKLAGWAPFLAEWASTAIFDEAQELRRYGSSKYAAACQVASAACYRVGLTNTPVYNYGGEIHTVIDALEPGVLGTRDEFVREWGAGIGHDHIKVNDPAQLHSYLVDQGVMLGRTRVEVGRELPPATLVEQHVDANLDELDRHTGDAVEMAKFILAQAGSHTDLWRARGELDKRLRQATGIAKAPHVAAFVKLLLESEAKVVLWGWHRAVYSIWLDMLAEHRPVLYTGSETTVGKRESVAAFTEGDSRVLIMSLRSGAGIDGLQKHCSVGVFGELDWSPQVHRQCVGRLRRDDLMAPVLGYFLVTDVGSDPLVAETLDIKRMQADLIVGAPVTAVTPITDSGDRVTRLAQAVLDHAGIPAPDPEVPGQQSLLDPLGEAVS